MCPCEIDRYEPFQFPKIKNSQLNLKMNHSLKNAELQMLISATYHTRYTVGYTIFSVFFEKERKAISTKNKPHFIL